MAQKYKRPPIVEAVIEIRFADAISREELDGMEKRLRDEYPFSNQSVSLNVEIKDQGARFEQQFDSYRMTSVDAADVVVLGPVLLTSSRLAPYEGWEHLLEKAKRNWDTRKRLAGFKRVARVGVRYINRIDISEAKEGIPVNKFLKFFPVMPHIGLPPMDNFAINSAMALGKDDCKLILNASSTPSPLVNSISFILDIDVIRDTELPQGEDEIWNLINRMREYKNFIFEGTVTDEARALFSQ